MWVGKSSLVNEQTMFKPLDKGGRAMIDLKSRNKAISVIWLRSFLKLGPDCPMWAYVADVLIAANVALGDKQVDKRVMLSSFLQSWKTKSSSRSGVCQDIVDLLKTAKEFNVRPEGLAFDHNITRNLPIWYHFAAAPRLRRLNYGKFAECLKRKHGIRYVGVAESLVSTVFGDNHIDF